jgi:hypothetical protein
MIRATPASRNAAFTAAGSTSRMASGFTAVAVRLLPRSQLPMPRRAA